MNRRSFHSCVAALALSVGGCANPRQVSTGALPQRTGVTRAGSPAQPPQPQSCADCGGTGFRNGVRRDCFLCVGHPRMLGYAPWTSPNCVGCAGRGFETCFWCSGSGVRTAAPAVAVAPAYSFSSPLPGPCGRCGGTGTVDCPRCIDGRSLDLLDGPEDPCGACGATGLLSCVSCTELSTYLSNGAGTGLAR